jgi:RNA polymerase sigma-70 factor (ECF subfamily)
VDSATTDSAETQRLLERVRAGDHGAFELLLARHRPYLQQVIQARLDPQIQKRVDASDVVQETQLVVARRIETYLEQRPMPFRLWLRKTAHERLLDLRRRHIGAARRDVKREVPLPDQTSFQVAQQLLGTSTTPSRQLFNEEAVSRIQQGIAKLSDPDREILLMRTLEQLSYEEIGTVLDIDATAARQRHGRALLRLHQALDADSAAESRP